MDPKAFFQITDPSSDMSFTLGIDDIVSHGRRDMVTKEFLEMIVVWVFLRRSDFDRWMAACLRLLAMSLRGYLEVE